MKKIAAVLVLIILASLYACSNGGQTDSEPTPAEGMSLPRMPNEGKLSEITISPAGYIHDIDTDAAGYTVTTFLDGGGTAARYDQTGKMLWEYRYAGAGNPTVTTLTNGNTWMARDHSAAG